MTGVPQPVAADKDGKPDAAAKCDDDRWKGAFR